jgi:glycosyltransferase involved in cell wall biosynthesis
MKITILSTAYPLRGGIAQFVELLYRELKKQHSVNIITFKRQYPKLLFPGKTQLNQETKPDDIETESLVDSINPCNWISVGKKIKRDAPDLLIFKYWMPFFAPCFGTITRLVNKNKKTKVLVICDNIIPHERKPGDLILTYYFFKAVDYFILMSDAVKKDLMKIKSSANYSLLFHPIYSNFGNPVSKNVARSYLNINSEKVILFFGFIRKYKGLDTIIEAMNILKDKVKLTLIVAGEFYTDKKKYTDLIELYQLNEQIKIFTDFIPNEEVKYYFSSSDLVVLPYKEATQSGIVQIAHNFIKPIIATNVGGLGEIVKDDFNGYLVQKDNPKELARAIRRFYDENKEIEFSKNIKEYIEKYSWSKFVLGIENLVTNT